MKNYKEMIEIMKRMLIERSEEIVTFKVTTFFQRGEKGGDSLAPIVTAFTPNHIEELRLYNDPNEEYLKVNKDDEIKSLELYSGYYEDEELEYMGSWSVVNGEVITK